MKEYIQITIIMFMILLTQSVFANAPIFRGAGWGIGQDHFVDQIEYVREVRSVYSGAYSSVYRITEEEPLFGGIIVKSINLEFSQNKMTAITVICDDEKQFIELRGLMRTLFGEPEVKDSFMKWYDSHSNVTANSKKLTVRLVDREHVEREKNEVQKQRENKIETYKKHGF